jgi:hypothetical protein
VDGHVVGRRRRRKRARDGHVSTALLTPDAWHGAAWVSSPVNGSLNTYRADFAVPGGAAVVRARAYLLGLGYHKAWINGQRTDGAWVWVCGAQLRDTDGALRAL